jgi:hypothetical protein
MIGGVLPICLSLFAGQDDCELWSLTKANGDEKSSRISFQRPVLSVLIGVDLKGKEVLSAPLRKQRKAVRPGTKPLSFKRGIFMNERRTYQ